MVREQPNPYRCETCDKRRTDDCPVVKITIAGFHDKEEQEGFAWDITALVGCTSHSAITSGQKPECPYIAVIESSIKDKLLGQLIEEYESGDNSDLMDCNTTDEWYGHGWEDATDKFVKHLKDIRLEILTPLPVPTYQSGEDHKSNVMSKKTIKAIARDHARIKGERY